MRIIKEFKVSDFDQYNFSEAGVDSPVFFAHKYDLEDICGKVVHISERRRVINVEFLKTHQLSKFLKDVDLKLSMDLVYSPSLLSPPRVVNSFVVYADYGNNNV